MLAYCTFIIIAGLSKKSTSFLKVFSFDDKKVEWKEKGVVEIQISLPFIYDFDRALERLAGDPVNAVDLRKREVKIPMEEGNIITLRGLGTKDSPMFLLENAIDKKQVDKVKSIFHFDIRLDTIANHFRDTNLEKLFMDRWDTANKRVLTVRFTHEEYHSPTVESDIFTCFNDAIRRELW